MAFSVEELRRALADLDHVRYGGVDLHEAMTRIVSATHDLFSVDGAALMLLDEEGSLRNAAVSDARLGELEELQLRHGDGPCIEAFERKTLIGSEDLAHEKRWSDFSHETAEAGFRAILASPIPFASDAVGVITVFSSESHAWKPEAELALVAFTDLAALAIATQMRSDEHSERINQLQRALDSRVVIEQAKGILAERRHCTSREAYEELRATARRDRRKVADVAAEIVRGTGPT